MTAGVWTGGRCGSDVAEGGETAAVPDMAERVRRYDWAATPLGPIARWPQSLRTAVDLMLASGHAMCLAWGPERTFLYNDAYAPIMGRRHPQALGKRFEEAWPDVWPEIAPLVDRTFHGETSTFRDMPLSMTRHGHAEETWWSFSYSPVRDEAGEVAGLLNVTLETTDSMLAAHARDVASEDLRRSEATWRSVFETLQEGFVLGELIRDDDGRVVDWRYEAVNDAWFDLLGISDRAVAGRTIREIFPGVEDGWVRDMAQVVEEGRPVRFTRQVGVRSRWYDGVAQRVGGDRFAVIFAEVTDRVLHERRQAALIDLNDRLRDETGVAAMAMAASAILAAALHADQVAYGDVDAVAGTIAIGQDWALDDAPSLTGTWRLDEIAVGIDELAQGRIVAVADCRTDPRTHARKEALEARGLRAFVHAPVVERGRIAAMILLSTTHPREWSEGELHFVGEVADRLRLAIARAQAEQQQDVLNRELTHRIKNMLSVVQAIAMQTLARKADPASVEQFGSRLTALTAAHDVLLTRSWSAAELRDVAAAALASVAGDRVRLSGPDLLIGSRAAMSLSLLLHELATNAVKYGALQVPEGEASLTWAVTREATGDVLTMDWVERGGPPVAQPTRTGFGSRLIRMGLTGSGGVKVRYDSKGLSVTMQASIDQVCDG